MLKIFRFSLASLCFGASLACLVLWWRSYSVQQEFDMRVPMTSQAFVLTANAGTCLLSSVSLVASNQLPVEIQIKDEKIQMSIIELLVHQRKLDRIGKEGRIVFFPLWYSVGIFAFAGVAVLRLGQQFTIRSAMVVTTVVAGLIGAALAL